MSSLTVNLSCTYPRSRAWKAPVKLTLANSEGLIGEESALTFSNKKPNREYSLTYKERIPTHVVLTNCNGENNSITIRSLKDPLEIKAEILNIKCEWSVDDEWELNNNKKHPDKNFGLRFQFSHFPQSKIFLLAYSDAYDEDDESKIQRRVEINAPNRNTIDSTYTPSEDNKETLTYENLSLEIRDQEIQLPSFNSTDKSLKITVYKVHTIAATIQDGEPRPYLEDFEAVYPSKSTFIDDSNQEWQILDMRPTG